MKSALLTAEERLAVEAATDALLKLLASAWRMNKVKAECLAAIEPLVADYIAHAVLVRKADQAPIPVSKERLQ